MLNSHPRAAGPRRRFAATLAATLGATLLLGACEGGRGAPDPASRDLSPAAQEPVAESPRAGTPPGAAGVMAPVYALANRCWQLGAGEQAITPQGGGYALATPEAEAALYLRPTGLGSYVLRDTQGGYLTLSGPLDALADPLSGGLGVAAEQLGGSGDIFNIVHPLVPVGDAVAAGGRQLDTLRQLLDANRPLPQVAAEAAPSTRGIWHLYPEDPGQLLLQSAFSGQWLGAQDGALVPVAGRAQALRLVAAPAQGCVAPPEIASGGEGQPPGGELEPGVLYGFADTHVHLMAADRLGGRVIHGQAWHPLGVAHALEDCAIAHGPQGSADGIGNFQREGQPAGVHATDGWPSFSEWPVRDTLSHQQAYYAWLKRAWQAGLRLVVNHFNADEALCQVAPRRAHGCDEMDTVRLQLAKLEGLQDYIDAQHGGPGRGWLRIVREPAQARQAVAAGQLAVVLGIESSKLFGCGEFLDSPECTPASMQAQLDEFAALGIRSLFLAHWFDNALGGPGLFGPTELALNAFNKIETGHYYRVESCPEEGIGAQQQSVGLHQSGEDALSVWLNEAQAAAVPTYGPGPHCNARGMTGLGEALVDALMRRGLLIEIDHLSYNTKERLLTLAERARYPLIAGHLGTGGATTPQQLERLYALGGLASPFNDPAPALIDKVQALRPLARPEFFFGVAFASDSGGLASQPQPRADVAEAPLQYPFASWDGAVRFDRQTSGERVYDLNVDGVAHYGLYADLLADMQAQPGGPQALELMARAAEAYIRMWERAQARGAALRAGR